MLNNNKLLPNEAAEYLGCSYSWILREARKGNIAHYKIGHRVFFRKSSLDLWVEHQERRSVINE